MSTLLRPWLECLLEVSTFPPFSFPPFFSLLSPFPSFPYPFSPLALLSPSSFPPFPSSLFGVDFHSPPLFLSVPSFPFSFLHYPFPSPLIPFTFPSHSLPFLPTSFPPQIQLRGLGERCKLPNGVRSRAPAENAFCSYQNASHGKIFSNISSGWLNSLSPPPLSTAVNTLTLSCPTQGFKPSRIKWISTPYWNRCTIWRPLGQDLFL